MTTKNNKLYYVIANGESVVDGPMCRGAAETVAIGWKKDEPDEEVEIVQVVGKAIAAEPIIEWS